MRQPSTQPDLSGVSLCERLRPYLRYRDPAMVQALTPLPNFAASNEPILIEGETGTGKERVALASHSLSLRSGGPFVVVNCGAIPQPLLEAELFGHERGAFTGALKSHRGRFEQAHRGTLFLDEIGEMPPAFQVRLLRVLEDGVLQRLGAEHQIAVDVRIIAATHKRLRQQVEAGLFRRDLFYRLAVLPIHVPPLRDRPADIPLLAQHFLSQQHQALKRPGGDPTFSADAFALLMAHDWAGNVRELRNLITRVAIELPPGIREIQRARLQPLFATSADGPAQPAAGITIPVNATLAQAEALLIDAALKRNFFNRARTAKQLGLGERTLRRKLNHR